MIETDELIEKIKNESPSVKMWNEKLGISTECFIVEGDVGLTEAEVLVYAAKRIEIAKALQGGQDTDKQGLLGMERDGKTLRWRPGKKLTYCVWRPSFPSDEEYQKARDGMLQAAGDWAGICGVEFEHVESKDNDPNLKLGDVLFPVLRQAGGGNTIAMAFFPDHPVKRRIVWVFDGFYSTSTGFDPIGVMRHELGHVLGFRHEHIRPEAPDLFNPESMAHTVEITEYDPTSVMHYVAENVGDPRLRFTDVDRRGARAVYGGPFSEFSFED
jgi:hypothetical protein